MLKMIKNLPQNLLLILLMIFGPLSFNRSLLADENIPDPLVRLHSDIFKHNQQNILALNFQNAQGWHTYWKNPGDAGLPIKVEFFFDGKAQAEAYVAELEWPVPHRYIEEGDLLAYGLSDNYSLFYTLSDEQLQSLEGKELKLAVTWLICKHVCIPGKKELSGKIEKGIWRLNNNSGLNVTQEEVIKRLDNLPGPTERAHELDFVLAKKGPGKLALFYNFPLSPDQKVNTDTGLLMPFNHLPFNFKREELFRGNDGHLYGKIEIDWDGEYQEPPMPFPADGRFEKSFELKFLFHVPGDKTYTISKSFDSFLLDGAPRLESLIKGLHPVYQIHTNELTSSEASTDALPFASSNTWDNTQWSLALYLLLAFFGGLLLNVMPCVLPVISLKLFALAKVKDQGKRGIFRHNLFYSLGIMATFGVLAALTMTLKSAGHLVGWGFQLQSPYFILAMITLLFVMALNLFGLFEFTTPGGTSLGGVQLKEGPLGDFFSGTLATILSTPCSAPFLGTALTFAFSSGPFVILAVFMSIALGLSFPFLITAFVPALVNFLPRPGAWMENVKKFLGLTLLFTIIWLIDVYISLTAGRGGLPLLELLSFLTLLFFAFYFYHRMGKRAIWKGLFIAIASIALIYQITQLNSLEQKITSSSSSVDSTNPMIQEKNQKSPIPWQPWSEAKLSELRQEGKVAFIDFTAKWCFTCKVNEKLVLDTEGFYQLAKEKNLTLLLADWTKRDEIIGLWLRRQGIVGVPAYFILKADGQLVNLGETISLGEIKEAL